MDNPSISQIDNLQNPAHNLIKPSRSTYNSPTASRLGMTTRITLQPLPEIKKIEEVPPPEAASRDPDPINNLIRKNAIPESMKVKNLGKPTDADVFAEEFDLEMFRVLTQREYRQITRYDTWENDLTPEQ